MPSLRQEALALDREAEQIASRMSSEFIKIGRIMDRISDNDRWRLLDDPRNGRPYHSLESWVNVRFRSQRATAFAARKLYRQLHPNVPDVVLESSEPGALKIMAMLPESAQRNPEIHDIAMNSTTGEFTQEALNRYPNELIEKRVQWILKPTLSQAAKFDETIAKVQSAYQAIGASLSREDAVERIFAEVELEVVRDTLSDGPQGMYGLQEEVSHG